MKKIVGIILLVIVIILSFGFSYLKYASIQEGDNYFNANLRHKFARYPIWRKILGLHYDGDARADYLGERYSKILVRVSSAEGLYISDAILKEFMKKITAVTGKPADYIYSGQEISLQSTVDIEDLEERIRRQNYASGSSDAAMLYLAVADKTSAGDSSVGYTVGENGIVLLESKLLENYSHYADPERMDQYITSVLVHEFGHQLGLGHNEFPSCIMNATLELGNVPKYETITTDYCDYEKGLIKALDSNL